MHRRHVLVVNSSPEFLDVARVFLQSQQYNVTTTNLVPLTFQMISVLHPDAIVVDLAIGTEAIFRLVRQLARGPRTADIPLVLTATDSDVLDRAQDIESRAGGRFLLTKPFNVDDLVDVIHSLIGPA